MQKKEEKRKIKEKYKSYRLEKKIYTLRLVIYNMTTYNGVQELLEAINLARLQDARSIYKNKLYFYPSNELLKTEIQNSTIYNRA